MSSSGFSWNVEEDFKTVPESWIPAHRVKHDNGHPLPDEHGHIPGDDDVMMGLNFHCLGFRDPDTAGLGSAESHFLHMWLKSGELVCVCGCSGWVPVEKNNKQYCWHSSVVDHGNGKALVLRPSADDGNSLEIAAVPLGDLLEQTLELIGTNVNGNPYGNARLVSTCASFAFFFWNIHDRWSGPSYISRRSDNNLLSYQSWGVRSSLCTAWCHMGASQWEILHRWTSSSCGCGSGTAQRAAWRASCGTATTARSSR